MAVKQIEHLFQLLELFLREQRPLSVAEMVQALGWPRSSTYHLVATLSDLGYLAKPQGRGRYFPSRQWLELGRRLAEAEPLPQRVRELLTALAGETGETIALAALEGPEVVLREVVESRAGVRYSARSGERVPLAGTAAGKALLAQCTASERRTLLAPLASRQAETLTAEIEAEARRGYFVNLGRYLPDLAGVAVPFPWRGRRLALVLGGPLSRVAGDEARLGERLAAAAAEFLAAGD